MLLHVIARGKIGRSSEAELVDRYARRISWPFRHTELPDSGGRIPAEMTPCRTVLLDERGDQLTSEQFAQCLGKRLVIEHRGEVEDPSALWIHS